MLKRKRVLIRSTFTPKVCILVLLGVVVSPWIETRVSASEAPGPKPSDGSGILDAIARLKARDIAGARELLAPLCPGSIQNAIERSKKQDIPCMLTVCAESESLQLRTPDRTSLLYWNAADVARLNGNLPVAKGLYEVAIDRYSPDPDNWYWLGMVERDLGDLPASDTALRKTLDLRPNDRDALYWIATNLMDERKFEESGAILSQLLERNPKDGGAWYRRGELLLRMGQCPKALEAFEMAESLGVDKTKVRARMDECPKTVDTTNEEGH